MIGLKNIIDLIDITILNIELYTVGNEWNYRQVNNPYSRIYYIIEGRGTIKHHQQEYALVPGQMYLIPCYSTVDMFCLERFTHYYVHFTARLQTGMDFLSLLECRYQVPADGNLINQSLFARLLELNPNRELIEYDAKKPIYQRVLNRAILLDQNKSPSNILETNALMRLLLSAFFRGHSHPQMANRLHGLKRFEKVLDYIEANLSVPLKIAQLARIVNLNPTYFCNLFSKLIGSSPLQYMNKRRIERAQELLLGTNETLYEISQQVGFRDEYYFSRTFKRIVGISPDHYRKQEKNIHSGRP